jgi:hypothetical protein
MGKIKKFNQHINETTNLGEDLDLSALELASKILNQYKNSTLWSTIITDLNNDDVDYMNWK